MYGTNPYDVAVHYFKTKEFDSALTEVKKVIQQNPENSEALNLYGAILASKGEIAAAIDVYSKALDLPSCDINVLLNRSDAYVKQGKYAEAHDDCNRALKEDKSDAKAHEYKAEVYRAQGKYKDALVSYNQALNYNPRLATTYGYRAYTYWELGLHDLAAVNIERAINLQPTAFKYGVYASVLTSQFKYTEAIEKLRIAIDMAPTTPTYYNNRAYAYAMLGQYKEALADYEKAINLTPDPLYMFGRGNIYLKLGQFEAARHHFAFAFDLADNKHAYVKLASALMLMKIDELLHQHVFSIDLQPIIDKRTDITAEDLCLRLLAEAKLQRYDLAQATCRKLLDKFLPLAIPNYLHKDFIRLLTQKDFWPCAGQPRCKNDNLDLVKDQLLVMIEQIDETKLKQDARLQILCKNSYLGDIFYIKREFLGKKPSLKSGRLLKDTINIETALLDKDEISLHTLEALQAQDKSFQKQLKKYTPKLYAMIPVAYKAAALRRLWERVEDDLTHARLQEASVFLSLIIKHNPNDMRAKDLFDYYKAYLPKDTVQHNIPAVQPPPTFTPQNPTGLKSAHGMLRVKANVDDFLTSAYVPIQGEVSVAQSPLSLFHSVQTERQVREKAQMEAEKRRLEIETLLSLAPTAVKEEQKKSATALRA